VLQKIGMQYEGCQRQHYRHGDRFEDALLYGILYHDLLTA
jgi:RimJ/RimL family protein N-acetyltransferase